MWAVCDVAMGLVMSKTTNYEMKEYPTMPRVPPMYFKKHEDPQFLNTMVFVPQEFTVSHMKKNVITSAATTSKRGRKTAVTNTNASSNNSIDVVSTCCFYVVH
jgi:sister-chromatid-cohesion protein PDS5